jgi:3-oxoacyl-[acyl-carrier protein] reductase
MAAEERRILVTGGTQGIGAALVKHARAKGHAVVFTGRDQARLERIASETGAHALHADVASDSDNARTVNRARQLMGGIDVLVNNAAYPYIAEIGELDVDKMRAMFATNVFGMVDLTNRVVPLLKAQGSGDIVNIASTSGMKGGKGGTSYAASKWAVRGLSQVWQAELRPFGVRVISVCPSEVQTNWGGKSGRDNPNKLYADDIATTIMNALDMPRRVLWVELPIFATNPWKED